MIFCKANETKSRRCSIQGSVLNRDFLHPRFRAVSLKISVGMGKSLYPVGALRRTDEERRRAAAIIPSMRKYAT